MKTLWRLMAVIRIGSSALVFDKNFNCLLPINVIFDSFKTQKIPGDICSK